MYRGRGAGRWAESSSVARVLLCRPPTCARTAARRDEAVMTQSFPSSPSRAAAAAAPLPSGLGYPASRRTHPSMGGYCRPPPAASPLRPGPATSRGPVARPCTLPGASQSPRVPPSLHLCTADLSSPHAVRALAHPRLTHRCSERGAGGPARFSAACCSGCAAGCSPEDPGSNPEQAKEEEEYEEEMRFRRPAVPVTEGTAAGVLCLVLRFCAALVDRG